MTTEERAARHEELMKDNKARLVERVLVAEETNGGDVTDLKAKVAELEESNTQLAQALTAANEKLADPAPADMSAEVEGLKLTVAEQARLLSIHEKTSTVAVGHVGAEAYTVNGGVRLQEKDGFKDEKLTAKQIAERPDVMAWLVNRKSGLLTKVVAEN